MGWNGTFLQDAVDTCTNLSGNIWDCPLFTLQGDDEAAQCKFDMPAALKTDDCQGPREGICGDIKIQAGPGPATYGSASATGSAPASSETTTGSAASPSSSSSYFPSAVSYSPGTLVVTGDPHGPVTIAKAITTSTASTSVIAISSTATSFTAESITPVATAVEDSASPISTSVYTVGNEVHEDVLEQVQLTVTATPTAAVRRHMDAHLQHYHRRHGRQF